MFIKYLPISRLSVTFVSGRNTLKAENTLQFMYEINE